MVNRGERKKVATFFSFTPFSLVGGTERSLSQYLKYAPEDWDARLIHSGDSPDENYLREMGDKSHQTFIFPAYIRKFDFLFKFPAGKLLLDFVVAPVLFFFLRFKLSRDRSISKALQESDVVYLVTNSYSFLLNRYRMLVVGSTHNWTPDRRMGHNILTTLVQRGLFWRRIDCFHVFPGFKWFLANGMIGFPMASGVTTKNLVPLEKKEATGTFIYFGRLVECKGVYRVVNAFEKLRRRDPSLKTDLVISGIGDFSLHEGADKQIKFRGKLGDLELVETLKKADCFVFPSTCDTFGLAVVEAIACGVYCIASDKFAGWFDEFRELGVLEYCSTDENDISKKMEDFLKRPPVSDDVRKKARDLVEERYSWSKLVPALYQKFDEMIALRDEKHR